MDNQISWKEEDVNSNVTKVNNLNLWMDLKCIVLLDMGIIFILSIYRHSASFVFLYHFSVVCLRVLKCFFYHCHGH